MIRWPWRHAEDPEPVEPLGDPEDVVLYGRLAQQLLDSQVYNHALGAFAASLSDAWVRCEDPVERERLWERQKVLSLLRVELKIMVDAGKVMERQEHGEPRLAVGE